ncbi:uncharacterized protein PV09_01095 [Verruconis gallopava]|uniref:Uncharacterized protein n=1 Tax=Verruconis gallopava TaxID=253628 RepID=A0A0D2BA49_9PEZI|nr:uncharacterized protein PV09_01095 [Verruconis gallopava]KIW08164.1 hypothetical protein PV09_01095 [Verruconis gallopava]
MSKPKPATSSERHEGFQSRKLGDLETFADVMAKAPQEARPFLMDTVKASDETSILLNNGNYMTYNGVIICPQNDRSNAREWIIKEPWRRLDGTIVYGDHWERKNNGVFVAPSGLMIDKNLTLIHRNGQTIFPDGAVVMPNGKMQIGQPNTVGIIYRPGLSPVRGIQHWALPEPSIDEEVLRGIVPADPSKGIVVSHPQAQQKSHSRAWDQAAAGATQHTTDRLLNTTDDQAACAEPGKYVPPHVRTRMSSQTEKPKRRIQLTLEELNTFTPPHLRHLLRGCDADGCGTDIFGIPMCLGYAEKLVLLPYAKEALKIINGA